MYKIYALNMETMCFDVVEREEKFDIACKNCNSYPVAYVYTGGIVPHITTQLPEKYLGVGIGDVIETRLMGAYILQLKETQNNAEKPKEAPSEHESAEEWLISCLRLIYKLRGKEIQVTRLVTYENPDIYHKYYGEAIRAMKLNAMSDVYDEDTWVIEYPNGVFELADLDDIIYLENKK